MQNNLPPELLKEATKCTHDFSCLNTGRCGDPIDCKVDSADGKNILFLKSNQIIPGPGPGPCPYRMSFATEEVCRCPIHFYLYKKK